MPKKSGPKLLCSLCGEEIPSGPRMRVLEEARQGYSLKRSLQATFHAGCWKVLAVTVEQCRRNMTAT